MCSSMFLCSKSVSFLQGAQKTTRSFSSEDQIHFIRNFAWAPVQGPSIPRSMYYWRPQPRKVLCTAIPKDLTFCCLHVKASLRNRRQKQVLSHNQQKSGVPSGLLQTKRLLTELSRPLLHPGDKDYRVPLQNMLLNEALLLPVLQIQAEFPSELILVGIRWELQPSKFSIL